MKKFELLTAVSILLLIIINSVLFSQPRGNRSRAEYYSYGEKLYAEACYLPSRSIDSTEVLVMFRIMYDAVVFVQENRPYSSEERYSGVAKVEIEARDQDGIIRKRALWSDTVVVDSYERTNAKKEYVFGVKKFNLKTGDYSISATLLDDKGGNLAVKRFYTDEIVDYYAEKRVSEPIFTRAPPIASEEIYCPYAANGATLFNSQPSKIFFAVSYSGAPEYFYRIKKSDETPASSELIWSDEASISGEAKPLEGKAVEVRRDAADGKLVLTSSDFDAPADAKYKIGVLAFDFPSYRLYPGNYTITVGDKSDSATTEYEFKVHWLDMPLSLRKASYAVKSMYYILSEEQYDEIDDGDEQEMFDKLLDFWKQKDPTPNTAFNEAMATYFERVDYAFFNYQTISEKDGSKTDRGKIYILHGAPDEVERILESDKAKEVWSYENLEKKFVFETVSNGVFKLVDIEE